MVKVKFGDISVDNGFMITSTAQQPLSIEWIADSESLTSIIMVDLDAPYPAPNNINSPYLHLLVTNIKGMDIKGGDSLINYMPPTPPSDSLPHNYNIDVYLQPNIILPVKHKVRTKFNLMKFVSDHNLQLVDRASFKVGSIVPTAGSSFSNPISYPVPSKPSGNPVLPSITTQTTPTIPPIPTIPTIPPNQIQRKSVTENFFVADSDLPENKRKFCRCVLKVADKQRGACNIERAWFETREGKKCYSPYRVCAKSVGTTSRECGKNYDFNSFSDDHLITYAQLHQKDKDGIIPHIPDPYDRQTMLDNIKRWKELKEK